MFEVRGVTIEPSLAWLLQPLAVQTFLDEIWGAKHHHVKRRCAGYFDSLLQGSSPVEELLELFRREPSAVRLMRGKNKKGPDTYRLDDGSLDLVRIRDEFADGHTIVLDGVERYVRPIALLCQSIEVELNFPTQVNAYITPPGSQDPRSGTCTTAPTYRRTRCGATIRRLLPMASRCQPTCALRSATCYTCHAAESMRPRQTQNHPST
jgi:hypothetical protein